MSRTKTQLKHIISPAILSLYVLVLILGSLHPIVSWQWPASSNWLLTFENETRYTPSNDLIINFLIYIPLGVLIAQLFSVKFKSWQLFITTCLSLALLSLTIECLQLFIPSRAQSFVDFSMNTLGASCGAFFYLFLSKQNPLGIAVNQWRYTLFARGRFIDLGLLVITMWSLAKLTPFIPALSFEAINVDLISLNTPINTVQQYLSTLGFALEGFAIMSITALCLRHGHNTLIITLAFCLFIFTMRIPIYGINTSNEQFIGLILASLLFFALKEQANKTYVVIAVYAIIFSYIISQLNLPLLLEEHKPKDFNWIPFYFQFNRITQIREILETIWTASAICFLVLSLKPSNPRKTVMIGIVVIPIVSFLIEWQQQKLQLSSPDITNIIIATGVWVLPFFHPSIRKAQKSKPLP